MTLEQRLERLERKVRWMRRIGLMAAAVAAAVVLVGQGKEKLPDLVARSLTLKDENGVVRLVARVDHGGRRVSLGLLTRDGDELVNLNATTADPDSTAGVTVTDKRKSMQIGLANHSGLGGGFYIRAGERIQFGVSTDPEGTLLKMKDENGRSRLVVGVDRRGRPSASVIDAAGEPRAVLGAAEMTDHTTGAKTTTAENAITLIDAKGNVIWKAPKD